MVRELATSINHALGSYLRGYAVLCLGIGMAQDLNWVDKFRAVADEVIVATFDGSRPGKKGEGPEVLRQVTKARSGMRCRRAWAAWQPDPRRPR